MDGGPGTDGEDGGGGGGGDARDIAAVRASAGRGVFYVESKPAQVRKASAPKEMVLHMKATR